MVALLMTADLLPDVLDIPAGLVLEEERDLVGGLATAVLDAGAPPVYRYLLTRIWDPTAPLACWVMLNPSTATAQHTDHTLRRVVSFTQAFGCGGLAIVNLFALRSTQPDRLLPHPDPVGPHGDRFLRHATTTAASTGGPVIAAWGSWGNRPQLHARTKAVTALLRSAGHVPQCLGTTTDTSGRQPLHPLMLNGDTTLRPYTLAPR